MAAEKRPVCVRCAVRLAGDGESNRALADRLLRQGLSGAVRFASKDDDELDAQLCAGRFDRVVFPDLDALLEAVWNHHAHLDRWAAAGVRIDLAVPPGGEASDWRALIGSVYESLARHRRRLRRRQIAAALVLSVLALLAVAVLLWLIPPAR